MTGDRQPSPVEAVREATRVQRRAANPGSSVALRASAGSGKTSVLVDRFVRLCIEGNRPAHPRSILAVTFTRKAAVEIQERLLARAARLALAEPAQLRAELTGLFADRPDPEPSAEETARAARLYESVLEDVSGLNVGTIHSFCQLILNRFAIDAGLDPQFTVLEDRQELLDEALDELQRDIAGDETLAEFAQAVGETPDSVRISLQGFLGAQMRIQRWLDGVRGEAGGPRTSSAPLLLRDLRRILFPDLDPEREPDPAALLGPAREALADFATAGVDAVIAALGSDGAALVAKDLDKLRAQAARQAAADPGDGGDWAAAAAEIFLTKAGAVRSFTRMRKDPEIKQLFQDEMTAACAPALQALRRWKLFELYGKNRGLIELGLRALDRYDELKRRDRVVDFQDLEELARRLMSDPGLAISLLYRLDDSLTHILLDEFQDTNFNQWEILQPFVDEFLSGEGDRTVFFVGDGKQSIYEFRGAEPDLFAHAERVLADRDQPVLTLPTNFRSLSAVVDAVGCLFGNAPLVDSIAESERPHLHQLCARREAPGRVIVLQPIAPDDDASDRARGGDQVAAELAARRVTEMVATGETTWEGFGDDLRERPLVWNDFLVLCRTRTEIGVYEKAFRDAGIPIAPSGRGLLAASREVQDILALLRWLVYPADDTALAAVLRSPLFRLGEEDLQRSLARRGLDRRDENGRPLPPRGLWAALVRDPDDPVTGEAVQLLAGWRKHLGFVDCHETLRRIYREGHVLDRFSAALGEQARYNLLRLFDLSMGPEMGSQPTVRRLAELIERAGRRGGQDEGTLPRGGDEGRVRFLTIHGAKGLEAPVVLLVDADRPTDRESALVRVRPEDPNSPVLFHVTKQYRQPAPGPAGEEAPADDLQRAAAVARARSGREETNLLYVALTRARDRLLVLGADRRPESKPDEEFDSPLRRILRAAEGGACSCVEIEDPNGAPAPTETAGSGASTEVVVEDLRVWEPPAMRPAFEETSPSAVEAEAPAAGEGQPARDPESGTGDEAVREAAMRRGDEIHTLLQLAAEQGVMPAGDGALHAEAAAVFDDPDLQWVFRPEAEDARGLSEAPVLYERPAAAAAVPQRIYGVIDRLVLRPGRADIVDYKTNRTGGDIAARDRLVEHYRPQLEAYREAIAAVYPERSVGTWLLFTDPDLDPSLRLVPLDAQNRE